MATHLTATDAVIYGGENSSSVLGEQKATVIFTEGLTGVIHGKANQGLVVAQESKAVVYGATQGSEGISGREPEIKTQVLPNETKAIAQLAATVYRSVIWQIVLVDTLNGTVRRSIIDATFDGLEVNYMEYAINGTRLDCVASADLIAGNITLIVNNETTNAFNVNAVLISDLTLF